MPVDPCAAAEAVECILGKGFPIAADSHGHVGADGREHAANHIHKELYHTKALCLLRTAGAQKLANLKPPHKISHGVILPLALQPVSVIT